MEPGGATAPHRSKRGIPQANNPDVLRLTEDRKLAYQVLTGQTPKDCEYDRLIRCHSSPEHTILNIQAAEILAEAEYLIQEQEIRLSNGGTFIPVRSGIVTFNGSKELLAEAEVPEAASLVLNRLSLGH
jgi:hypothetical protein